MSTCLYTSSRKVSPTMTCCLGLRYFVNLFSGMGYDRYKFIVQCIIGEQRGEAVKMACRCFWDSDTDNYAHSVFMNVRLEVTFCICYNRNGLASIYLYSTSRSWSSHFDENTFATNSLTLATESVNYFDLLCGSKSSFLAASCSLNFCNRCQVSRNHCLLMLSFQNEKFESAISFSRLPDWYIFDCNLLITASLELIYVFRSLITMKFEKIYGKRGSRKKTLTWA